MSKCNCVNCGGNQLIHSPDVGCLLIKNAYILDKRAREILGEACDAAGMHNSAHRARVGGYSGDEAAGYAATIAAIRAALTAAPEGYRMVPVEPTDLMAAVFRADNAHGAMTWTTHTTLRCADFRSRYVAMLNAAKEVGNG